MKKIIEFPTVTQSCIWFGRIDCQYNFKPLEVLLMNALEAGEYGERIIRTHIETAPVIDELENIEDEEELIWEEGYTEYTYNNPRYFRYRHTAGDNPNDLMALYEHLDKELYKELCKLVDNTTAAAITIDCGFYSDFTDGSTLLENNGMGMNSIEKIELVDGEQKATEETACYHVRSINKTVVITHNLVLDDEPREMTI